MLARGVLSALCLLMAVTVVGCAPSGAHSSAPPGVVAASSSVVNQRVSSTSTAAPPTALSAARTRLATLAIKGRAPKTGYGRSKFGRAWNDDVPVAGGHNGCNTRDDILQRDLARITLQPGGCKVMSGTLHDPYTGTTISFVRGQRTSTMVQIDHVVALADAWQKGAQQWTPDKRLAFANDPRNLQAVDGSTNQRKGAGDAATWLPPNKSYRCTYVSRQIAVKATYALWVTKAEHDAMARVLDGCR